MKRIKTFTTVAALLLAALPSFADEGMWMVSAIDKAIHANMRARGLKLKANEIYNAEAEGADICDAVVSMDFGCTGSIISHESLVITNHHCAYEDVHALSTDECNYLEDGFWAASREQEIPIPGKRILTLKRVLDVTDEVKELYEKENLGSKMFGFRIASSRMDEKYCGPGEETQLSSMWSGSRYYLSIYNVYTDIRLVAAPPVSIAAYGGETDNWEWPQHKCDFAIYRIYTAPDGSPAEYAPGNVPLKSGRKLEISTKGLKEGDYAMVIGFPGTTHRYNSSSKTFYERYVKYPIETDVRRDALDIMQKWMDSDPAIRLKYSNTYFGISNVCELYEGTIQCYDRFGVIEEEKANERQLQQWIDSDPRRKASMGDLLETLDAAYSAQNPAQTQLEYFRESIIRACHLYTVSTRVHSLTRPSGKPEQVKDYLRTLMPTLDMRVEKDLFDLAASTFYANVDSSMWGPFQKDLYARFNGDPKAISDCLWDGSWAVSDEGVQGFLDSEGPYDEYIDDNLMRFFEDAQFVNFSKAVSASWTGTKITALDKQYTQAMYEMRLDKGIPQYPDANSSMRLTYGTVGGFSPRDGITYSWQSRPVGILEKYNPEVYDFNLKPEWKALLETEAPDCCVDFITDCDITGGNSGSPVMDAKGRLVGLAFDGNKESLAGDASFTQGYNKCVCVDIRFVLWTLKRYAGLQWVLDEIALQ